MQPTTLSGVIAAAATPLNSKGDIDASVYIEHCHWLLDHGCDGINALGTTGEANSLAFEKRRALMSAVASSDLPMGSMMVGTGGCSLEDTISLTQHALELGFAGQLILPPFYYKPVSDEGLFSYFSRIIESIGEDRLKIYLYNFPQLTGIAFSTTLVERLYASFPETVVGLKDSSGDLDYSKALVERCHGFAVFPSSEGTVLEARKNGFAGCISATVNLTCSLAGKVWKAVANSQTEKWQEEALSIRQAIAGFPLVPAVKVLLQKLHGNDSWADVLPPLLPLSAKQRSALLEKVGISEDGARLAQVDNPPN